MWSHAKYIHSSTIVFTAWWCAELRIIDVVIITASAMKTADY